MFWCGGQIDRHQSQRFEYLAIRRITRRADAYAITAIEQRCKCQQKAARRPRRDNDTLRVQIDIVPIAIHPGDPLSQRRQTQRYCIAQRSLLHFLGQRLHRPFGRTCSWLTNLHMNDVAPVLFCFSCSLHHVHHDEGIDPGPG